ncbi:hypothetical protein FIU89_09330 [Roseovarius sp. THAF27]|nr:hypothetical protein FIU89_09330 [Roseovarius sp. THAF27]
MPIRMARQAALGMVRGFVDATLAWDVMVLFGGDST